MWKDYGILKETKISDAVNIIGVGGIGSMAAISLAKIGMPKINIFDFDKVEEKNINNQFYPVNSIGHPKTESMKKIIEEMVGDTTEVGIFDKYVDQPLSGIVISAVDSMEARKAIWEQVKLNPAIKLYIDGRMGGEMIRIYAISPIDLKEIERYEDSLYDDPFEVPCTEKRITYNTFINGGLICSLVKKLINEESLPWQVVFDLKNYAFKTFAK